MFFIGFQEEYSLFNVGFRRSAKSETILVYLFYKHRGKRHKSLASVQIAYTLLSTD